MPSSRKNRTNGHSLRCDAALKTVGRKWVLITFNSPFPCCVDPMAFLSIHPFIILLLKASLHKFVRSEMTPQRERIALIHFCFVQLKFSPGKVSARDKANWANTFASREQSLFLYLELDVNLVVNQQLSSCSPRLKIRLYKNKKQ